MNHHSPAPRAPDASLRERLGDLIARVGVACFDRPLATLGLTLLLVVGLASQLPRLYYDTEPESMLEPGHPIRVTFDTFRHQFGGDDLVLVALTPPEVFAPEFLAKLRDLHERLENELPYIDEVQSLVNARFTRGEGDTLIVGELLEEWPESDRELEALRARVMANPFYRNLYVSEDGETTAIVIRAQTYESAEVDPLAGFEDEAPDPSSPPDDFLGDEDLRQLTDRLTEVLDSADLDDVDVHVAGNPVINFALQDSVRAEMSRSSGLAIASIALLLAIVFRRLSAVLLPLVLVSACVAMTLGVMAMLGHPITFVSQVVPSFLLAVGVGSSVHVLAIYYQRIDSGEARSGAIDGALRHSGPAIAMSSLTTAGGMLSFAAADLTSVRSLGTIIPIGAILSAALAICALPALLALAPARSRPRPEDAALPFTERILIRLGVFATRHPIAVLSVATGVLIAAATGLPRLQSEFDFLNWLPDDLPAKVGSEFVDARLGGATSVELSLDSGRNGGFYDPDLLQRVESIQRYAETNDGTITDIQKSFSVVDVVKEIHQALHGGDPNARIVPDDQQLVTQELLLFENSGSDDLEEIVDSSFQLARVSLGANVSAAAQFPLYLDEHLPEIERLAGDIEVTPTGMLVLSGTISQLTTSTTMRSYAIAFVLITPLMILLIGSLRTGLVSMAPNLMPIVMVIGVMGWSGAPLDVLTCLVGGVALGLVVDDTIHILHGFHMAFRETGDVEESTRRVMRTTGRALLFTTSVLGAAFAIFVLGTADPLVNFGWLTSLAIVLAFIFDVLLSPALLALVYRRRATS